MNYIDHATATNNTHNKSANQPKAFLLSLAAVSFEPSLQDVGMKDIAFDHQIKNDPDDALLELNGTSNNVVSTDVIASTKKEESTLMSVLAIEDDTIDADSYKRTRKTHMISVILTIFIFVLFAFTIKESTTRDIAVLKIFLQAPRFFCSSAFAAGILIAATTYVTWERLIRRDDGGGGLILGNPNPEYATADDLINLAFICHEYSSSGDRKTHKITEFEGINGSLKMTIQDESQPLCIQTANITIKSEAVSRAVLTDELGNAFTDELGPKRIRVNTSEGPYFVFEFADEEKKIQMRQKLLEIKKQAQERTLIQALQDEEPDKSMIDTVLRKLKIDGTKKMNVSPNEFTLVQNHCTLIKNGDEHECAICISSDVQEWVIIEPNQQTAGVKHAFCLKCLHRNLKETSDCPSCRQPVSKVSVVFKDGTTLTNLKKYEKHLQNMPVGTFKEMIRIMDDNTLSYRVDVTD